MVFEWWINFFRSCWYFAVGLAMAYYKFLSMPGAPIDRKLHCWFCCAITVIVFILSLAFHNALEPVIRFLGLSRFYDRGFGDWLLAAVVASLCALMKEWAIDFWFRRIAADRQDILSGLRGVAQATIWIWTFLAVRGW